MTAYEQAKKVIPGGVNSPVRAFNSVGGEPFFTSRAEGSKIYDTEENSYIDYVCSWGPLILGHADKDVISALKSAADKGVSYGTPTLQETELAEIIVKAVPSMEMVRMVSSGTEAVMSAIRAARAFTSKDKIIKFEGCYHGHSDSLLVKAGSGMLTLGAPSSPGVPADITKNTLTAQYNDIESVKKIFNANKNQIACVIVEPVAANMGVVKPKDNFLKDLQEVCRNENALLIFDEVISGFRLSFGGAQQYYGISADITTLGKIIGGGLPIGAYGGRKEIMNLISPAGDVYQAGTLSGNPLAVTAGIATLKKLSDHKVYEILKEKSETLYAGIKENLKKLNLKYAFNSIESLSCLFFTENDVTTYKDAIKSDTKKYAAYFHNMLKRGVFIAPAQFEAAFMSIAHTDEDIDRTIKANYEALKEII